jgi:D-serine deaminase-like pyridoxal phosphate-dependent protein
MRYRQETLPMVMTDALRDRLILDPSVDLDTPSMLVDEALMELNISEMQSLARSLGCQLRPHIKTHKTPQIALRQIGAGARGITCAKLGEAEVMADAGVEDILMAYPVVTPIKLQRLLAVMERTRMIVALDDLWVAELIATAMNRNDRTLDVYLEVNTGQNRAGKKWGQEAVDLAVAIARLPGLRLIGIMTHEGQTHTLPADQIAEGAREAGRRLVDTAEAIRRQGVEITEVSVGSTPSSPYTASVGGVTEMRPGTYVFRDTTGFLYGMYGPERCAARVLATVVAHPAPDRAILDSGSKTLALDMSHGHPGHGYIVGHGTSVLERLSEEHGVIAIAEDDPGFTIGERVEVIPNHICPSINLFDELMVIRDGRVIDTWAVAARGKIK